MLSCREKLQIVGVIVGLVAVTVVNVMAVRNRPTVEELPHKAVQAHTSALIVVAAKVVVLTSKALLAWPEDLRNANISPGITVLACFQCPVVVSI